MKESDFQGRIVAMAERFGWQVWHVPAPMVWDARTKAFRPARGGAGLPDLIMLHDDPPRMVFMEVKAKRGKLSDRQQEFLQAAKAVADEANDPLCTPANGSGFLGVYAVWPEDEERIEQMLRTRVVA